MSVVWAYRGTQTGAWYSLDAKDMGYEPGNSSVAAPAVTSSADPSVFGGSYLDCNNATAFRSAFWSIIRSWSTGTGFAILVRFVPNFTGSPSSVIGLITTVAPLGYAFGGFSMAITTTKKVRFYATRADGTETINVTSTVSLADFTSGVAKDIMVSWDYSATAGSVKVGENGALIESLNPTTSQGTSSHSSAGIIALNHNNLSGGAQYHGGVDEAVLFNNAESVAYGARSAFWSVPNLDITNNVSAGAANIRAGVTETIAGVVTTGTCAVPSAANTKTGVAVDNTMGTYTGSDLWSDPGLNHVETGIQYLANGVTLTGVMDEPNPANVRAGVTYDNNTKTGTLAVPAPNQVLLGVATDNTTGTRDDAPPQNVSRGVTYAAGTKTGTLDTVTNYSQAPALAGPQTSATLRSS
jgi:hypothetical protein